MVSMAARRPPARRSYHIMATARAAMQDRFPGPRKLGPNGRLLLRLQRILDRLEGRELDGPELAAHLLDLAEVDVLHDVAGLRIDRDRPARALPLHALHRADQG